jgi:hypothetical protein
MSLLARALLVSAALALLHTSTAAKEIKGAPEILLGVFAKSQGLCGGYYHNIDDFAIELSKVKGKYYYSNCNSKNCVYQVLGYKISRKGYVLRLREVVAPGEPTEQFTVSRINNNKFAFTERDRVPRTYIRCTDADVAAAIGLPVNRPNDPEFGNYYAVYYARLVPGLCPGLVVDQDIVNKRLATPQPEIERLASYDPPADKAEIKDYCREVLKAFGPNGRVIPDLLRPAASER